MERTHQVEALINSREFIFIASRALPMGGGSIDLTTNSNFIKYHSDLIECYMPYFGRAYNVDYGGDGGIKFEAKPKDYHVGQRDGEKGFELSASVSAKQDYYQLMLFVSPDGSASLSVTSTNRDPISYFGNIDQLDVQKDK